ncbi:hypothetical protein GCM10009760_10810 [Kitasatospora kazusensis]|uniref:DNA-binding protein n=1 Tax=Kitasatospora kazusensis TaxID=407974 RepID=A0ABN2YYF4_9ACTN
MTRRGARLAACKPGTSLASASGPTASNASAPTPDRRDGAGHCWTLSRVKVESVTEQAAKASAELLKQAGLHGHTYAVDATVAEMTLRQPVPVAMLTSDVDGMARLCGNRVRLIAV